MRQLLDLWPAGRNKLSALLGPLTLRRRNRNLSRNNRKLRFLSGEAENLILKNCILDCLNVNLIRKCLKY